MTRHLFDLKTNDVQATLCGATPDKDNLVRDCSTNVNCTACLDRLAELQGRACRCGSTKHYMQDGYCPDETDEDIERDTLAMAQAYGEAPPDPDDGYYYSGSGEHSLDDSYIDYLNH